MPKEPSRCVLKYKCRARKQCHGRALALDVVSNLSRGGPVTPLAPFFRWPSHTPLFLLAESHPCVFFFAGRVTPRGTPFFVGRVTPLALICFLLAESHCCWVSRVLVSHLPHFGGVLSRVSGGLHTPDDNARDTF